MDISIAWNMLCDKLASHQVKTFLNCSTKMEEITYVFSFAANELNNCDAVDKGSSGGKAHDNHLKEGQ